MTDEYKTDSARLRAIMQEELREHEARLLAAIQARENAALRWLKKFLHSLLSYGAGIVKSD